MINDSNRFETIFFFHHKRRYGCCDDGQGSWRKYIFKCMLVEYVGENFSVCWSNVFSFTNIHKNLSLPTYFFHHHISPVSQQPIDSIDSIQHLRISIQECKEILVSANEDQFNSFPSAATRRTPFKYQFINPYNKDFGLL